MFSTALRRLSPAISLAGLILALVALVAAAAGVGYAAATIGTAQLKDNAVTAPKIKKNAVTTKKIKNNAVKGSKVKDRSLAVADLPAQEAQQSPTLGNGGEGDCAWQSADTALPGYNVGGPRYRKDLFGRVHLSGI